MNDSKRNMEIATTIRSQIKAMDFWAFGAWGAKEFVAIENGLRFKVKCPKHSGFVEIKLNGLDLYDVRGYTVRKVRNEIEWKTVEKFSVDNVYVDQLLEVIDKNVG